MAIALSSPYNLISDLIALGPISFSGVTQTAVSVTASSNSSAGQVYVAYRYTGPWTSAGSIISAAVQQKAAVIGGNQFSLANLTVGAKVYVGIAQQWTTFSAYSVGEVQLLSALPGPIAPAQCGQYPDQIFYKDVPLLVDLLYGWQGTKPLNISVSGIPPGCAVSIDGKVTGSATSIANVPCVVTVSNDHGSETGEFNWYGMTLAPPAPVGMTRAEILDLAKAYADRQDIEVEDKIGEMLSMAEDRMSRIMRNREMSSEMKIPIVDGQDYYALPADYAGLRHIKLVLENAGERNLTYVQPAMGTSVSGSAWDTHSSKTQYTILNNKIYLPRAVKGPGYIELSYFQRVPQLIKPSDTNWVLTHHRDVYLTALSAEIELFAKNDERAALLWQKLDGAFEEISMRNQKDTWSSGPMTISVEGY